MDVGEILQIANNLVQLDMDVAQNQLAISINQRRRVRGEGGGGCGHGCREEHFMGNMRD